ncbi:hypothetical protein Nepgr_024523 [Nepenthes gracilis]|uniref:Uncharacterized protein n=1 Tax=Nepenthes gracilis TaxID=150966 RepID=A0AAD3Y053_NEPGR|nr:hypothetical protein Nepgr_024523 [Nepenthes gracilis]
MVLQAETLASTFVSIISVGASDRMMFLDDLQVARIETDGDGLWVDSISFILLIMGYSKLYSMSETSLLGQI